MGEIVITESMVTSSPDLKGLKLDAFTKSARQLRKLTDELQDVSMSLRMVPVSGRSKKCIGSCVTWQKSWETGQAHTGGEDTEVDKTIVDSISDPIMHIVRTPWTMGSRRRQDRIRCRKDPGG